MKAIIIAALLLAGCQPWPVDQKDWSRATRVCTSEGRDLVQVTNKSQDTHEAVCSNGATFIFDRDRPK